MLCDVELQVMFWYTPLGDTILLPALLHSDMLLDNGEFDNFGGLQKKKMQTSDLVFHWHIASQPQTTGIELQPQAC